MSDGVSKLYDAKPLQNSTFANDKMTHYIKGISDMSASLAG